MPLYTKCLKCGGWKAMPESPGTGNALATGLMMNLPEPPKNLCSCSDTAVSDTT